LNPFGQGHLDSLCGIYSIINATQKIIGKFTKDQAIELFMKIIKYLDKDRSFTVFLKGASLIDIGKILRDVIYEKYEIKMKMPFKNKPDTSLKDFWEHMTTFLKNDNKSIILWIEGGYRELNHWTVVDSITAKQIKFCDSDGLKRLYRRDIATKNKTATTYQIAPTHAYFLSL
jgi:hypothetical protein